MVKKIFFILLSLTTISCRSQILPGVTAGGSSHRGSSQKEYVDIPDAPTFSDSHTLVYATTGSGIQSGDTGSKIDFLVGSDYPFMSFNGLSGNYRIKSLDGTNPSTWATLGSPSPNDYSFSASVSTPGVEMYNLRLVDSDNILKMPGASPTKNYIFQNLILEDGSFAGFLINENVAGQDYGSVTYRNCRVLRSGGEPWYNGKTGGGSLAFFRGTTALYDCYSEDVGRDGLQFNGHTNVVVERYLSYNGGLDITNSGIGQSNCIQIQDVYTFSVKKSIFWNFPAPGMIAADDGLFEDCFFYFTDDTRTMYLQSMVSNGYTEMVHTGGTLTFRRCTFYNPNFTGTELFTMQGSTRNYVFEDCILPESVDGPAGDNTVDEICDDQRSDKVTYSVTISGTTFDDTPNIPSFSNPPEAAFIGFEKVISDNYYYYLGYGPRNPNGL